MGWAIEKLTGHVGASLTGHQLNHLTDAAFDGLRDALFTHGVIAMPDQHLAPEAHIDLAKRFGEIDVNRFFKPVDGYPEIAEVRTTPEMTRVIGGTWHSDHSYDPAPAMCSILSARALPPYGGDTQFASMVAAAKALSPGLHSMLEGLRACHTDASFGQSKVGLGGDPTAHRAPVSHPVLIHHPQTGAQALYVNGDFTTHFEGWSEDESAPLLDYLYRFATQPAFTCRVRWTPGKVTIWDNRLVQHYATADYSGHARLMHRITVAGQPLG